MGLLLLCSLDDTIFVKGMKVNWIIPHNNGNIITVIKKKSNLTMTLVESVKKV